MQEAGRGARLSGTRPFLAQLSCPESKLGERAMPATCGIRIAARSLRPVLSWPAATASLAASAGACGLLSTHTHPPSPEPLLQGLHLVMYPSQGHLPVFIGFVSQLNSVSAALILCFLNCEMG